MPPETFAERLARLSKDPVGVFERGNEKLGAMAKDKAEQLAGAALDSGAYKPIGEGKATSTFANRLLDKALDTSEKLPKGLRPTLANPASMMSSDELARAQALGAEADARKKNEAAYAELKDHATPDAETESSSSSSSSPSAGGGGAAAPPADPGPSKYEKWRVGSTVRGAFDKADAATQEAIDSRAAGETAQGEKEMGFMGDLASQQRARAEKLVNDEKSRTAVLQSYREQYDRMSDQLAGEKIDSNRLWNSKSTGQKIMDTIGVMMGGFVSGATGQANDALAKLERDVDRAVADQVHNYDIKKGGVEAKKGAFALAMNHFDDERKAEAAAYSAGMDATKTEISKLAVESRNVEVQARAKDMIAKLEEQKAARLNQMLQYMLGGGGGGGSPSLPGFNSATAYTFNGKTYDAGDAKAAAELREGVDAVRDMRNAAERIEEARKEVGWTDHLLAKAGYDTPAMAHLKSEAGNYVFAVKKSLGPGLNSEGDFIRVEKAAGDGSAWTDSGMAAIKGNVDRSEQNLERKIQGRDDAELAKGFVKNTKGVREQKAVPTGHTSRETGRASEPASFQSGAGK